MGAAAHKDTHAHTHTEHCDNVVFVLNEIGHDDEDDDHDDDSSNDDSVWGLWEQGV